MMELSNQLDRLLAALAVEGSEEGLQSALSQLSSTLKPLLESFCDEGQDDKGLADSEVQAALQTILGEEGAIAATNIRSSGSTEQERDFLHLLGRVARLAGRAPCLPPVNSTQLLQLCMNRLRVAPAAERVEAAGLLGALLCAGRGGPHVSEALRVLFGPEAAVNASVKVRKAALCAGAAALDGTEAWDSLAVADRLAITTGALMALDAAADLEESERERSAGNTGATPAEGGHAPKLLQGAWEAVRVVLVAGGGRSCWVPLLPKLGAQLSALSSTKGGGDGAATLQLLRAGAGLLRMRGALSATQACGLQPAGELPESAFPGQEECVTIVRLACGFLGPDNTRSEVLHAARRLIELTGSSDGVEIAPLTRSLLSSAANCIDARRTELQLLQGFCMVVRTAHLCSQEMKNAAPLLAGDEAKLLLEGLAGRCRPSEEAFSDEGGTPLQQSPPQGSADIVAELQLACARLEALTVAAEDLVRGDGAAAAANDSPGLHGHLLGATLAALPYLRNPELSFAWSSKETGSGATALLAALAKLAALTPVKHPVLDRTPTAEPWGQASRPVQVFLRAMLTDIALAARQVVIQKHPHMEDQPTVRPYMGPNVFARSVAAFTLSGCLQSLAYPMLNGVLECGVLPICLAACEDPAPTVQRIGHSMLTRLSREGLPAELREHKAILLEVTARCVTTADTETWNAAVTCAVSIATALEGATPQAEGYARLMGLFLDAGELNAAYHGRSLTFLRTLPPLVEAMKLQCVLHFSRVMPLLLDWLHAPVEDLHLKAAECLKLVMEVTWPRIPAHSAVLLEHFCKAYENAAREQWDTGPLEAVVEMLLHICGPQLSGCGDLPGAAGALVAQLLDRSQHQQTQA